MLCKKSHLNDCEWYGEEQLAERWELSCHKEWLEKAQKIGTLSGLQEEQLSDILQRLYGIISEITSLKEFYPALSEIIDTVITEASKPRSFLALPKGIED